TEPVHVRLVGHPKLEALGVQTRRDRGLPVLDRRLEVRAGRGVDLGGDGAAGGAGVRDDEGRSTAADRDLVNLARLDVEPQTGVLVLPRERERCALAVRREDLYPPEATARDRAAEEQADDRLGVERYAEPAARRLRAQRTGEGLIRGGIGGGERAPRHGEEQHRLTERGEGLEAERGGRLDEEHAAEPLDPPAAAHGDLGQGP